MICGIYLYDPAGLSETQLQTQTQAEAAVERASEQTRETRA